MYKSMFLFSAFIVLSFFSYAQTLAEATQKTLNERFEAAEADFNAIIAKESTIGANYAAAGYNYFYWGISDQEDIVQLTEKLDAAEKTFRKGMEIDLKSPLCLVGLGHLMAFRKDSDGCNQQFTKAEEIMNTKSNKVDKLVKHQAYLKMAEACLIENNMQLEKAFGYLNIALPFNDKNPEVYIQLGDYYSLKDGINQSNAIAQYNKALEIDPKSTRAILRKGMLYKRVKNWKEASNYYKEAIALDPSFAPAYRERAEMLNSSASYDEAITTYAKYKELNNNCRVNQRYAMFIYNAKDYKKALEELEKSLPCNDKYELMYRVLGYTCFETGDYAKGLQYMDTYFSLAKDSKRAKITPGDYGQKGKLLSKTGQDSIAIIMLQEAISQDSTYVDGYSEIASIYSKQKKHGEAAKFYELKIKHSNSPTPKDYYYLGQSRFFNKEYSMSDSAFSIAASQYPDANYWRARCKNTLEENPDQPKAGLAKPYYELFIQGASVSPQSIEANKKNLIAAYNYLAVYYSLNKNYECSRAALNKTFELDPTNKTATQMAADKLISEAKGTCELFPVQTPVTNDSGNK